MNCHRMKIFENNNLSLQLDTNMHSCTERLDKLMMVHKYLDCMDLIDNY